MDDSINISLDGGREREEKDGGRDRKREREREKVNECMCLCSEKLKRLELPSMFPGGNFMWLS